MNADNEPGLMFDSMKELSRSASADAVLRSRTMPQYEALALERSGPIEQTPPSSFIDCLIGSSMFHRGCGGLDKIDLRNSDLGFPSHQPFPIVCSCQKEEIMAGRKNKKGNRNANQPGEQGGASSAAAVPNVIDQGSSSRPAGQDHYDRRTSRSKETRQVDPPAQTAPDLGMHQYIPPNHSMKDPESKLLDARTTFQQKSTARPGFAQDKFQVYSNYLTLDLGKPFEGELLLFHIDGIQDTMTRPKKKVLIERLISKCALLHEHRQSFVTDYQKKILAWTDISKHDGKIGIPDNGVLAEIDVDNFNPKTPDADPEVCKLRLNIVKRLTWNDLNNFVKGDNSSEPNSEDLAAVNLLVSEYLKRNGKDKIVSLGTNKIFVKSSYSDLRADCKLAIDGFSFGYQGGMGKSLLNVNPITCFFHMPIRVSNYIANCPDYASHLKGVRVWLDLKRGQSKNAGNNAELDNPGRRMKTIAGFGKFAGQQDAYRDAANPNRMYTVHEHMDWAYPQSKCHRNSRCVNLGGSSGNEQWFAADDLVILPYQIYRGDATSDMNTNMIRYACRTPAINRAAITSGFLPFLNLDNAKAGTVKIGATGVEISPQLLTVPACYAAQTQIQYDQNLTRSSYAMWKLENQRFLSTGRKFEGPAYFLLSSKLSLNIDSTSKYLKAFHKQYYVNGVTGLRYDGLTKGVNYSYIDDFTPDNLRQIISQKARKADLVVLILPQNNKTQQRNYAIFKAVVDQELGMKSLVICEAKVKNCFKVRGASRNGFVEKDLDQDVDLRHPFAGYARNIAMKLNVRLGNQNHTVEERVLNANIPNFTGDKHVMILGADVVHPGAASAADTPSIAAIVGTIDAKFAAYRGSARYQEGRVEIIGGMQAMVSERLKAYQGANKTHLPSRIIYYRDGIDPGQYDKVLAKETSAIRDAWKELAGVGAPSVKVTTIIVTKRHHTRFYPKLHDSAHELPGTRNEANGNCLPGTVVDSGVTTPYHFDFFLLSHNAIKGTARPAHYIVLQDEIKFKAEQIQGLTNVLCSTYARSITAVSYVPAAYYADHLCERVKQYLRPIFVGKEMAPNTDVAQELQRRWGLGGRADGNPWREALDDTMFWI